MRALLDEEGDVEGLDPGLLATFGQLFAELDGLENAFQTLRLPAATES